MTCTKTVSRDKFYDSLDAILGDIWKTIEDNNSSTVFSAHDGTPIISKYAHSIVRMLPVNSREENIFKQIIIEYMMLSEQTAGNSADHFLKYLIFLNNSLRKTKDVRSSILLSREICEKFKSEINNLLLRPDISDLKMFLEKNFDKLYHSSVFEILNSSGVNGKIQIKKRDVDNLLVEVEDGYSFPCIPDENLLYLSKGKYERENIKSFVIDGILERVSEIDKILNYAAETKVPVVIFCRGYSEEVLSTVMSNNMRGTLDVFLVASKIDENSLNDLTDICFCVGSRYFSIYGGDLLSSINPYEENSSVEKISITDRKITIINRKTKSAVQKHIKSMIKEAGDNIDLDYYKDRIRNLNSKTVSVYIPSSSEQKNVFTISNFDAALRSSKSVISRGIIKMGDLIKKFENDSEFNHIFENEKENIYPAESLYAATELATRCFEVIQNIDEMILIDN